MATGRTYCAYCREELPLDDDGSAAPRGDDRAWAEIARRHAPECKWVATRAHQRDPGPYSGECEMCGAAIIWDNTLCERCRRVRFE